MCRPCFVVVFSLVGCFVVNHVYMQNNSTELNKLDCKSIFGKEMLCFICRIIFIE